MSNEHPPSFYLGSQLSIIYFQPQVEAGESYRCPGLFGTKTLVGAQVFVVTGHRSTSFITNLME